MKKIAIITNRSGGGHIALTKGMLDIIRNQLSDFEIDARVLDPLPDIIPLMFYWFSVSRLTFIWQTLWKITDNPPIARMMARFEYFYYGGKIRRFISEFEPDVVISNSPMTISELQIVKNALGANFKTVIHIADPFSVHAAWISNPKIDLMLCPTEESAQIALKAGIPSEVVKVVGWLTRQEFLSDMDTTEVTRGTLGLKKDDYVLFLGGAGFGDKKSYEICQQLVKSNLKDKVKVIVNTGLNTKFLNKLVRLAIKFPGNFIILPYLPTLRNVMAASNIILGKAGPNFMFESIHLNKNLIATGCMPGQEEGNLAYIESKKIGWVAETTDKVISVVEEIIKNPAESRERLQNMQAVKLQHMNTAQNIAAALRELLV